MDRLGAQKRQQLRHGGRRLTVRDNHRRDAGHHRWAPRHLMVGWDDRVSPHQHRADPFRHGLANRPLDAAHHLEFLDDLAVVGAAHRVPHRMVAGEVWDVHRYRHQTGCSRPAVGAAHRVPHQQGVGREAESVSQQFPWPPVPLQRVRQVPPGLLDQASAPEQHWRVLVSSQVAALQAWASHPFR